MFLAIVIGALAAARSLGVRFVAARAKADDAINRKTSPPWQYTLAQLLSWTTLIAIVLGTILRAWDPRVDTGRLFTQALPFSILAIVVFFGAFQRQTLLAIILLLFAAPLFAVLPAWLEGGSAVGFWRDRLVVSISLTLYIVGAVAVIRTGGFRLRYTVGTQKSNPPESTEPNLVPYESPHAGP